MMVFDLSIQKLSEEFTALKAQYESEQETLAAEVIKVACQLISMLYCCYGNHIQPMKCTPLYSWLH